MLNIPRLRSKASQSSTLYVCVAFLVKWSDKLLKMDFQEVMMFLQALPTRDWTEKDIELLLSEAFIWQSLFKGLRHTYEEAAVQRRQMPWSKEGTPYHHRQASRRYPKHQR
jgi:hypothetical protein